MHSTEPRGRGQPDRASGPGPVRTPRTSTDSAQASGRVNPFRGFRDKDGPDSWSIRGAQPREAVVRASRQKPRLSSRAQNHCVPADPVRTAILGALTSAEQGPMDGHFPCRGRQAPDPLGLRTSPPAGRQQTHDGSLDWCPQTFMQSLTDLPFLSCRRHLSCRSGRRRVSRC